VEIRLRRIALRLSDAVVFNNELLRFQVIDDLAVFLLNYSGEEDYVGLRSDL
jgi:hypothetical protein